MARLFIDYTNKNNIKFNINGKNKFGWYPLLWTIKNSNIDYANKNNIKLNINDKNENGHFPLLNTVICNNIEMISLIIDYSNKNNIISVYDNQHPDSKKRKRNS